MFRDFWLVTVMDKFNAAAGAASIIGLLLTFKVSLAVRNIERFYRRRARLPDVVRDLRKHRSALSDLLSDEKKNGDEIRQRLSLLLGTLRGVDAVLDKGVKAEVAVLRNTLLDHLGEAWLPRRLYTDVFGNGSHYGVSEPRRIRDLLASVEEQLANVLADEKWRSS